MVILMGGGDVGSRLGLNEESCGRQINRLIFVA
jgi:hypothetical protein